MPFAGVGEPEAELTASFLLDVNSSADTLRLVPASPSINETGAVSIDACMERERLRRVVNKEKPLFSRL